MKLGRDEIIVSTMYTELGAEGSERDTKHAMTRREGSKTKT